MNTTPLRIRIVEKVSTLSRTQKFVILLMIDGAVVPIAFLIELAFLDAQIANIAATFPTRFSVLVGIVALVAMITSHRLGLPRIRLNTYEETGIFRTALFSVVLGLSAYIFSLMLLPGLSSADSFVSFTLLVLVLSVGTRLAMRSILEHIYTRGLSRKRVLIYGAGRTGVQLASALRTDPEIMPIGFLDDNPTLQNISVAGMPVYSPAQLGKLVHEVSAQLVVLAMPSVERAKLARISTRVERAGCNVSFVPSFSALIGEAGIAGVLEPVRPADFLNRKHLEDELMDLCGVYVDQNVMITGAGGSIGSELCRQVIACKPARLVLFELSEYALYKLTRELRDPCREAGVTLVPVLGSVTDAKVVSRTLRDNDVNVVMHSAAYKHVGLVEENSVAGMHNNAVGTKVIAEEAIKAGVTLFVQVSTDKAVRPTSMMGASKRVAELIVQDLASRSDDTRFSIVRFGNVLGSSGSVVPLFEEQIARGGPVTLTHPDVTRYFMTINEAARLVLLAGKNTVGGEVFVLDMGRAVPIRQLAKQMIERAGYSVRNEDNPDGDIEIAIVGLEQGEKLHEELIEPTDSLVGTNHPKILRAPAHSLSQIEVASAMRDLGKAIDEGSDEAVRDVVHRVVGHYRYDSFSDGLLNISD